MEGFDETLAFREEGFYARAARKVLKESLKFFLTTVLKPSESDPDQIVL